MNCSMSSMPSPGTSLISRIDARPHRWLPASLGDSRISQVVPFRPASEELDPDWAEVAAIAEEWRDRARAARAAGLASALMWHLGSGWASIVDVRQPREKVFDIDGLHLDVFL